MGRTGEWGELMNVLGPGNFGYCVLYYGSYDL